MNIIKRIARRISNTAFVSKAISEKADLSLFKKKPPKKTYIGIFLIGFSYIIGWPAVSLFGIISIYLKEPLIFIIGGPLIYGTSHLVFFIGMYLAGVEYTQAFLKWAARIAVEKVLHNKDQMESPKTIKE